MSSRDLVSLRWTRGGKATLRDLAAHLTPAELMSASALGAALVLWAISLSTVDPRDMTGYGLISALPVEIFVALGILTLSFAALAHLRPRRSGLLAAHVAALIALLHATPALVYENLRYSWAWKHLGIVDFIQRNGSVEPDVPWLEVYHSWPGFFAVSAVLQDLAGLDDLRGVASWAPAFFTVLGVAALLFALSSLTADRRVLWLSAWMFVLVNWVGQEYFSPQAFAFVLYLVVLGIVLRWLRPAGIGPLARLPGRIRHGLGREADPLAGGAPATGAKRTALVALTILLMAAIVASHALTSIILVLSLAALVLVGGCEVRSLPLVAAAMVAAWAATFAREYVGPNVWDTLGSIATPWVTTESNLAETAPLSDEQATIATLARALTVVALCLAALGAVNLYRLRALDPAPLALAVTPALLFLVGDYDGELIFRIYLFGTPFLAYFAAQAVPFRTLRGVRRPLAAIASGAVLLVLLAGFLIVHFGKDREYTFTSAEVAAAESIYREAPPRSLLIQGTTNAPVQFLNYENLSYVTISDAPPDTKARVLGRPVDVLAEYMADPRYARAYLLITRSQKADVDSLGALPRGSLARIEDAVTSSIRFDVERGPDAMIATLATPEQVCSAVPSNAGAKWLDGSRLGVECPRAPRGDRAAPTDGGGPG